MATKKNTPELVCDCEDGGEHETTVLENGDNMIECKVCKRFIKYPND
jgi:ribosomal protein S27E